MKKKFLKPFAATVGALIASTNANAAIPQVSEGSVLESANLPGVAGGNVVLDHSVSEAPFAQHSSHASHASHASHSSHASSSY